MKPALATSQWAHITTAILIMYGEHGQANAGCRGGCHNAFSHFALVVIGFAVRGMMKIVKLYIGGVARLQHFHLHQGGNCLNVVWGQLVKEPIHQLTPSPKTICGIVAAMFC